jgi:hypothetical protein
MIERLGHLVSELGQPALGWYPTFHHAWRTLITGHLDEAERLALNALQIGIDSGQPDAFAVFTSQLVFVRRDQGRLAELEPTIAQVAADNPGIPGFRALLALCYCELDDLEAARRVFAADAARGFVDIPHDMVWSSGMAMYAEVCSHLGDREAAAALAGHLSGLSGILVHSGAVGLGAIDRYRGLLSATLDRLDQADAHFAAAAALEDRIGAPIWLARTRLDWGRLLLGRGGASDRERGQELVAQAIGTAKALGCVTLAKHASRTLKEACLMAQL